MKEHKGRGSLSNPTGRCEAVKKELYDDGWGTIGFQPSTAGTTLRPDANRSIISRNQSPDIPFNLSINPYRGCEHGCIYCYARPSHAWLGHSPGLDFETQIYFKENAAATLKGELGAKDYRCEPIALGGVTDAYQPVERHQEVTRRILELCVDCGQPLTIVTKSALVERDLDLLTVLAERGQAAVLISLTTLDSGLARRLEPRASAPQRRLQTISCLHRAGIPVGVLIAPLIPILTDGELEVLMHAARQAGARSARYTLLRLPLELAALFTEWLEAHAPMQSRRILNRIKDTQGGCLYRSEFGKRMTGSGPYAEMISQRFGLAFKKHGFESLPELDCSGFVRPQSSGDQLELL